MPLPHPGKLPGSQAHAGRRHPVPSDIRQSSGQALPSVLPELGRHHLLAAGYRLDPGAINGQQFTTKQLLPAAETNEFPTDTHNSLRMIPAKVGYGLVGRRNTVYQPHHFDVAPRFPLDHAARSHPVQVTVHVQL